MKIIRDGYFAGWVNSLFIFIGGNIAFYAIFCFPNNSLELSLFASLGLFFAGIGGYSSQAHTLKTNPFNGLTFPKNKPSEKTPPESLFEKILDWTLLTSTILIISILIFLNQ